jgi:endonuclease YncB( thermonuclease family)
MDRLRVLLLPLLALLAAASAPALAEVVAGEAYVVDGDTLEIRGQYVLLHGIDAPELKQACEREGAKWLCGLEAWNELRRLAGAGAVRCEGRGADSQGRILAVCRAGEVDLGAAMVASGFALADRQQGSDYVEREAVAQAAKLGVWAGEMVPPWEWRQGKRLASEAGQSVLCVVKGTLGPKGERTYHMPAAPSYAKAAVDPKKGGRWFCTEAEARAAGWQRAK